MYRSRYNLQASAFTRSLAAFGLAGACLLADGCGGGGGGSTALPTARGVVQAPTGVKMSMSGMQVAGPGGTVNVGADGSFAVPVLSSGPALVQLNNSSGKTVLLGFVDPAASAQANTLSTASTATALEYFDLGGFTLPLDQTSHTLAMLASDPNTTTLATAIQSRMAANVTAVGDDDSQIAAALSNASAAIIPGSGKAEVRSPDAKTAGAIASSAIASGARALFTATRAGGSSGSNQNAGPPLNIVINPDKVGQRSSGVTLSIGADDRSIVATNNYRRACKLYLAEQTYIDSNGQTQNVGKQIDIKTGNKLDKPSSDSALDIPETQALGGVPELVNDVFKGKVPWAPVSTSPIAVPLDPSTAKQTTYRVAVVGPLPTDYVGVLAPLIWTDQLYASYHEPWETDMSNGAVYTFAVGIVLPFIASAGDLTAYVTLSSTAGQAVAAVMEQEAPQAVPLIEQGQFQQAFQTVVQKMEQPGVVQEFIQAATGGRAIVRGQTRDITSSVAGFAAQQLLRFVKSTRLVFLVSAFARFVDMGAVIKDNMAAAPIEGWTVQVMPGSVRLQPQAASVSPNQSQALTATTTVDQSALGTSTMAYIWKSTGTAGVISDSAGHSSATGFTSTANAVSYQANANATPGQSDTVTVTAYVKPQGASSDPSTWYKIGTASSVITIQSVSPCPDGTPSEASLTYNNTYQGAINQFKVNGVVKPAGQVVVSRSDTLQVTVSLNGKAYNQIFIADADPNQPVLVDGVVQQISANLNETSGSVYTQPMNVKPMPYPDIGLLISLPNTGTHTVQVKFRPYQLGDHGCPELSPDGTDIFGPWVMLVGNDYGATQLDPFIIEGD